MANTQVGILGVSWSLFVGSIAMPQDTCTKVDSLQGNFGRQAAL